MKASSPSLLLSLLAGCSYAQVFDNLLLGVEYPGISQSCALALNTTVSCPSFLASIAVDNPRLVSEQLAELCTAECSTSLADVRKIIAHGCNQRSDSIPYDGVDWPATLIIDRFLYTYSLSCRKDRASGKFCDEIFFSWLGRTSTSLTAAEDCSDCMLGLSQIQLNSPFGYSDDFAADFDSLTSSCSASAYPYTSPEPYAISPSSTASPDPTSTPTCSNPYQVQPGDSCDSIAIAHNVSTHAVLLAGDLNPTCSNLFGGSSLCLPDPCALYRVQYDDTCDSIVSAQTGISGAQLLIWNPNINMICGNIGTLVNTLICVGPLQGFLPDTTAPSSFAAPTVETAVPKPTNALPESNARCGKWYVVQSGDYCETVSIRQNIAILDFYFLNPEINSDCTNLLLGVAYCVQAVGDISTYESYTTIPQGYSLTPLSFTTTTLDPYPAEQAIMQQPTAFPSAPGTLPDCPYVVKYLPVSPLTDQSQSQQAPLYTNHINSCVSVAAVYGVELSNFLLWNPSLATLDTCELQPNYTYCASNGTFIDYGDDPGYEICFEVDNILPGTISPCSCFTTVQGYDRDAYPCMDIADDFGITEDQIMSWNPWIGPNCDVGLYAELDDSDERPLCVAASGSIALGSTTTTSTTPGIASPAIGPTQAGTVSSCAKYYTVINGDSCSAIEVQFGITFEQFHAWNPSVGSNCESLWLGYAYCVSSPPEATSSVPVLSTPPMPTRSGTPDDCARYYTVQSGDTCWAISQDSGINLDTLYKWNPSVGSDCESLWPGYSLCVAGGPL